MSIHPVALNSLSLRFGILVALALSPFVCNAASVDSGEKAYERCALCHGLYGITPRSRFPILSGQNPLYLENQIQAFLSGKRTNDGGQMQSVVTELSEEQIAEVVDWFSSQELPAASASNNKDGEAAFSDYGCSTCHLENRSSEESVPLLYAQHKDYLEKQIRELREGERITEYKLTLHQQLGAIDDNLIGAIAEYLASQDHKQ